MDRRDKLLQDIDVAAWTGVEIGALCRPFLRKTEGEVIYVDHADTATLRRKYRDDPGVVLEELVEVDAVWGANTLAEALGRKVDYVVASHVVEHVPDLISWLEELSAILNDRGEVRLIVPDRRFTFDYLRAETVLADILYARLVKARIPQPHVVLEYVLNVAKVDGAKSWRGELDGTRLERLHTAELALRVAQDILDNGTYHDAHCWVFSPLSFAMLMEALAEAGQLDFKCSLFHDTQVDTIEFFVGLQKCADREEVVESWRAMRRKTRQAQEQSQSAAARADALNAAEAAKAAQAALAARVAALENTVASLRESTSWRVTAPLRALGAMARRFAR